MTVARLAGRGRGSTAPGFLLPWLQGWLCAGQGACGRAAIRAQAAAMASAQGQVAAWWPDSRGRRVRSRWWLAPVFRAASTTAADFATMAHAVGCAFSVIMASLIRA
jgi:hypothetical protein